MARFRQNVYATVHAFEQDGVPMVTVCRDGVAPESLTKAEFLERGWVPADDDARALAGQEPRKRKAAEGAGPAQA